MLNVNCYLCGSKSKRKILQQKGEDPYLDLVNPDLKIIKRAWYICKECGFIYRTPRLDERETKKLYNKYDEDVFKNTSPNEYFDKIINLPKDKSENYQKCVWLKDIIYRKEKTRAWRKDGISILDVGCGGGTLLYTISKYFNNTKTYGVELNTQYASLAMKRSGAITVLNQIFEPGLFECKINLVILAKVLEHVLDPIPFIQSLSIDVSKDGYLFIEVPDILDFHNLEADHPRFFIPHIYYFSPNTLAVILQKAGLEIVSFRTIVTHRNRAYLQAIARHNSSMKEHVKPYDDPDSLLIES